MMAWRAGPPSTCKEEAMMLRALTCQTWTSPVMVRIPRANPGSTLHVCVIAINFLRFDASANTPPNKPKMMNGKA